MDIEELKKILIGKGFKEEKLDTGCNYTNTVGHIDLICYIEPGIDVAFITFYRWNDNEVKGTYDLSVNDLKGNQNTIASVFKKTLHNMPRRIGESIDVHKEVEGAINKIFN